MKGLMPSLARAIGAGLLAVPFLPLRRLFAPLEGASALVSPGEWALGLAIFGVLAWLAALLGGDRVPSLRGAASGLDRGTDRAWFGLGIAVLAILLVAASRVAFRGSPHLIDSVVQLFQAKIFASGALVAPSPPDGGFFTVQHMITDHGGWYSQYPPGHPALLAVGVTVDAAWAVPVLLSLGAAGFLHAAARRMYGPRCGRLTLVLLVLCPFFWFMGASFMNHVSALFFVAAFLYLFVRWEEERTVGFAGVAGAALGAAALSRPLTVVALAVPFTAFALASPRDSGGVQGGRIGRWSRRLRPVAVAAAGFVVVASLYLLYNARVTGDPLLPGYLQLWGESHGLGFHATPWGGDHTPLDGLRNELLDISLLNLFLFEWPVPALLPVGAAFALGWTDRYWDRLLLAAFLAIPAAYFFYWHRDAFLGPRFLYSGVAFLIPLTARSLLEAGDRLSDRTLQLGNLFRPVGAGRWAALVLLLCAAYAVGYAIPQRFRVYATGMPSMKANIVRDAREAGIDRGLIFVKVSWGNRILAQMRAEGVPAGTTERAYRTVGHCELHLLLEESRASGWSSDRLTQAVERHIDAGGPLVKTARLNGDPTLRLRPGRRLEPACEDAVRYDESGYTIYSRHLTANSPDLSGPFVVARDLRDQNFRLRRTRPDLPAYLFVNGSFEPLSRVGR